MVKKEKDIIKEEKRSEEKIGVSSLDVLSNSGNFVRTYSVAVHGSEFVKLAEMYSKKIGGSIRKKG